MERYKNISGTSGIVAFEITADSITVLFKDGKHYLYTTGSAGIQNVSAMQTLAKAGSGLNNYINKNVRKRYSRKW
jgi:hypothetical protein